MNGAYPADKIQDPLNEADPSQALKQLQNMRLPINKKHSFTNYIVN